MPDFRLRTLTADDAEATHEVAERYFQVAYGHGTYYTPELIRSELVRPGLIADLDLLAVERDGQLIAAGIVNARAPYREVSLSLIVEPRLDAADLTECLRLLLERFDDSARERVDDHASAGPAHEAVEVPPTMPQIGAVLRDRHFEVARHVYEMVIDLSGGYRAPEWPLGFTRRSPTLAPDDVAMFSSVFTQSFADHPGNDLSPEDAAHELTLPTTSLALSTIVADEAGPVGLIFTMVEDEGGYIGALGVLPRARRRGLGSALLGEALAGLAAQGVTVCRLHVQAVNPTAVALYRQAGMTEESTTDIWLRPTHR
jgi:ribosomal protein S18 acetylase RimI-like enzyme